MARRRTAAEHYTQAERNEAFYRHLGGSATPWPDWAVTALFYAALHRVQAALRSQGNDARDHHQRKAKVRAMSATLAQAYEGLQDLSEQARYDGVQHNQMRLGLAEAQLQIVRDEIANIAPPPY